MLLYRGVQAGEHAILRYMKDEEAKRELLQKVATGAYQVERQNAIAKRTEQEREAKRDGAQWKRFHDPYHAGATYYYNTITGKSQWDEPPGWTEPPSLYAHTEATRMCFRGIHPQLEVNTGWLHSTKGRRAPGFANRDAGEMVIAGKSEKRSIAGVLLHSRLVLQHSHHESRAGTQRWSTQASAVEACWAPPGWRSSSSASARTTTPVITAAAAMLGHHRAVRPAQ